MNKFCTHFVKDYVNASRVADSKGVVWWEWVCSRCGQVYREKAKEPIIIE